MAVFLFSAAAFALGDGEETVWTDMSPYPVIGKVCDSTTTRWERLTRDLEPLTRKPVWDLGHCSSGLAIRFRTDSPSIRLRWSCILDSHMGHMADCGNGGADLYVYDGGKWRFAGSAFTWALTKGMKEHLMVSGMNPEPREFMLYLPLYDGMKTVEIGIPEGRVICQPQLRTLDTERPVVMYGTSILQGGCASRPGMAYTNILERRLGMEVVNLGFSGNAKLDYEIASYMTRVDNPSVFVLDFGPNSDSTLICEKGERFFDILRKAHPETPVIFVETEIYPSSVVNMDKRHEYESRNKAISNLFRALKARGEKKLLYVPAEGLIGLDGEATVDGEHLTDLGMMRYALVMERYIRKALKMNK